MATQDLISKTLGAAPPARITPANERRTNRRCKITQLMRIRPRIRSATTSRICAAA